MVMESILVLTPLLLQQTDLGDKEEKSRERFSLITLESGSYPGKVTGRAYKQAW